MAEEVKPIKTERIDNPDGTYTIKEIYDCGAILIEYSMDNKYLSKEIFNDSNCKNLAGRSYRKYNDNSNYVDYNIYVNALEEYDTNIKYQSSEIYNSDSSNTRLEKFYSDNNFSNLIMTLKTIYGGERVERYMQGNMQYDDISYCSRHDVLCCYDEEPCVFKCYADKNYSELLFTIYKYIDIQGYDFDEVECIVYEPILNKEYLSEKKYYNKSKQNCILREKFKDNNFKEKFE